MTENTRLCLQTSEDSDVASQHIPDLPKVPLRTNINYIRIYLTCCNHQVVKVTLLKLGKRNNGSLSMDMQAINLMGPSEVKPFPICKSL